MPRPATGNVRVRKNKRGQSYEIRFTAYGQPRYLHLGTSEEGWTRQRAENELANVLADVRRGIWQPPVVEVPAEPRAMPTFHEFASEWFAARKVEGGRKGTGLSAAGVADLEWRITHHLLPTFAPKRLDAITVEDVDRYRRAKVAEGRIGVTSINKALTTLAAILETAVEYELIARNPAKGRRRRLPAVEPRRTWIDRADHIEALLAGASKVDADAHQRRGQRRALVATLVFAGLRIGELLALRWRDVDLARGTLTVRHSKTDAGERTIDLLPVLRDELLTYRAGLGDVDRDGLVFGTSTGGRQSESNIRRRLLAKAVEHANTALEKAEAELLPVGLTPHSLRRTFASLLVALGEDPVYAMGQLGHTDPTLTLRIYAQQMNRRDGERERLKALVQGAESGRIWTSDPAEASAAAGAVAA
jgi:integrase